MTRVSRWLLFAAALIAVVAAAVVVFWPRTAPVSLVIQTGGKTGEYYDFGNALAALVAARETGLTLDVRQSSGSEANRQALTDGSADLVLVQSDATLPPEARAVAGLFPEVLHIVAHKDSGVRAPSDFADKRIALMPVGSGTNAIFLHLAAHYGFTAEELDIVHLGAEDAKEALLEGRVDVMARMIALGNAAMSELLRNESIVLVGVDQAAAIQLFAPSLESTTIPRGTLVGWPAVPPEDIESLGVRAMLIAHESVNDAVIERLTRLLYTARNDLLSLDVQTALLLDAEGIDSFGFPVHDGARAFYDRDKPHFFVEYAEALALGVSVLVLIASGLWQLRAWFARKRKNRADHYNQEILDLIRNLRNSTDESGIRAARNSLLDLFDQMVRDIDDDRISPESVGSLRFTWNVAMDMVRGREDQMGMAPGGASGS